MTCLNTVGLRMRGANRYEVPVMRPVCAGQGNIPHAPSPSDDVSAVSPQRSPGLTAPLASPQCAPGLPDKTPAGTAHLSVISLLSAWQVHLPSPAVTGQFGKGPSCAPSLRTLFCP